MLDTICLENFGPLQSLQWSGLGRINLVLGENGSGKSFLLKSSLYCHKNVGGVSSRRRTEYGS